MTCNVCQKVSIKFDPFCFLSVQIPAKEQLMAKTTTTADESVEKMLKNGPIMKNGNIPAPPPPTKESNDKSSLFTLNDENDGNGDDGEQQSTTAMVKPSTSQLSLVANISYGFFSVCAFKFHKWVIFSVGDSFPCPIFREKNKKLAK